MFHIVIIGQIRNVLFVYCRHIDVTLGLFPRVYVWSWNVHYYVFMCIRSIQTTTKTTGKTFSLLCGRYIQRYDDVRTVCKYYCEQILLLFFQAPGSGFNVAGRLDSGHIQVGESVAILPVGETATIKSMLYYVNMCVTAIQHMVQVLQNHVIQMLSTGSFLGDLIENYCLISQAIHI